MFPDGNQADHNLVMMVPVKDRTYAPNAPLGGGQSPMLVRKSAWRAMMDARGRDLAGKKIEQKG